MPGAINYDLPIGSQNITPRDLLAIINQELGGAILTGVGSGVVGPFNVLAAPGGPSGFTVTGGGAVTSVSEVSGGFYANGGLFQGTQVGPTTWDNVGNAGHLFTKLNTTVTLLTLDSNGLLFPFGRVYPGNPAGGSQTVAGIACGAGIPSNAQGANFDLYLRSDGGVNTTLYHKRAGVWVALTTG